MVKELMGYLLVVIISIVSVLMIVNWYQTGSPSKFFLLAHKLENTSSNIATIDVEFSEKKVFLNVHLKKQVSCKKIVAELGTNNIIIGMKSYEPTCAIVAKDLIQITYSEK